MYIYIYIYIYDRHSDPGTVCRILSRNRAAVRVQTFLAGGRDGEQLSGLCSGTPADFDSDVCPLTSLQ